jgi:hypothetical protein
MSHETSRLLAARLAQPHEALFCFALLTLSAALASLALACATPLAAFAVIAASRLPLRPALLVVAGSWLVNQGIGFGVLHYPIDGATLSWGLVIGAAALAATLFASLVLRGGVRGSAPLVLSLALACSYAAYELTLLAATPVLGGSAGFAPAVVARIGVTNAAWLTGLIAVCESVRLLNLRSRRTAQSH